MASEHGEQRATGVEMPYQGMLGRTRTETVQVWMPDGKIRALPVYVGIHAGQDAALAALARAGTLHHVAEGVQLAIPFTYHDPDARLFVLVVPEGLRHRALGLRAEQLALVAADANHAVPDYVREAEVVIGIAGLLARIQSGHSGPKLHGVDQALASRESALSARERELTLRERLLSARESALQQGARTVAEEELEEVEELTTPPFQPVLALAVESGHHAIEEVDQVEEVEELDEDAVISADGEDDDAEDVSDAVAEEASGDHALPAVVVPENEGPENEPAETVSMAPDAFASDPGVELCLSAGAGNAWLFVRGRPPVMGAGGEMELLVQLDPAREIPVVLITLVFDVGGAPVVRRGVVDPFDPEQLEGLRMLGESFAVELVAWSLGGTLDHWATVSTPREANVRAVLAVLDARGPLTLEAWRAAAADVLANPPAWRDASHPFQIGETVEPPRTATEAAVRLDQLSEWLTPERRQRLRLLCCVPDEVVDARCAEDLGLALDWGLSLSRPLAARAIELGVVKDEASLVQRRLAGLTRVSQQPDLGGLEPSVLRAQWSEALEQAARLGSSLSEAAREAATRYAAGEREQAHALALGQGQDSALDALRAALRAPRPELAPLLELVARGGLRDLLDACNASERLAPEAAAQLFARLARRDDPVAVDALVSLLGTSGAPRVRAGAALALSARKAVNAIDELARRVTEEATPDWILFATALGRYGAGSFRAITRALVDLSAPQERAAFVLAQLSLHGARSQLRAKSRVEDPLERELAAVALTLAGELKDRKKPASGLEQQGPLTVFSELFDRSQHDAV